MRPHQRIAVVLIGAFLLGCVVPSAPSPDAPPEHGAATIPFGSFPEKAPPRISVENHGDTPITGAAYSDEGGVWIWGRTGPSGGILRRAPQPVPTRLGDLPEVAALSIGLHHRLALATDGTVWAWGNEAPSAPVTRPRRVDGLGHITAIAAGDFHNLALRSDGKVWSWGSNLYGELGDGTWVARETPVPIPDLQNVVAVAAGATHSLALQRDGTVLSWGNGGMGRLGQGNQSGSVTPQLVAGLGPVKAIAAGGRHSLAITQDGAVWTWGNSLFALPDDEATFVLLTPSRVDGLEYAVAVEAGLSHSLVLTRDGHVWAWGYNESGELGDSTLTSPRRSPVAVVGLRDIVALAAGEHHSLALAADGQIWAWGSNVFGELGGRGQNPIYAKAPIAVPALSGVTAIAARGAQSVAVQAPVRRQLPQPSFVPRPLDML